MNTNKFYIEDLNFVERVFLAIEGNNPNDAATEIWNDEAVVQLASYLVANGFDLIDEELNSKIYFLYDLVKWTMENKATRIEQDGWTAKIDEDHICLNCLAGAAGEEPLYGVTINEADQTILIQNVDLVEVNECSYVEDHK